ncbi:MAG TPA: P-type DNA transfer ATPase VirB11 [Phenylobacterium sp.]|nr:P-type DNA transfer ATPase VirB11 [Phenylobacterium sp.]
MSVFLAAFIAPLRPWLERDDVSDILVNKAGEIWVETLGGAMQPLEAPELTGQTLLRLARQIAGASSQGVSREHPLLTAALPDGARVQIVTPPAARGGVVMAVRRHAAAGLSLSQMAGAGAFTRGPAETRQTVRQRLRLLLARGEIEAALKIAVAARLTMVISGGTASGKTTMMNALMQEISPHERLVTIEDAPELRVTHANSVSLISVRGVMGETRVTEEELLQAALRLRPDRILLGELRGQEAFTFLRAVNTGHPGSITTVHADSPSGAIDQIVMMSLLSGINLDWESARTYARKTIDLVVQMQRSDGVRRVSAIEIMEDDAESQPPAPEAGMPVSRRPENTEDKCLCSRV